MPPIGTNMQLNHTGTNMMPIHRHLYSDKVQADIKVTGGGELNHPNPLLLTLHVFKLTLPSFYKLTIGLNRQVYVYLIKHSLGCILFKQG